MQNLQQLTMTMPAFYSFQTLERMNNDNPKKRSSKRQPKQQSLRNDGGLKKRPSRQQRQQRQQKQQKQQQQLLKKIQTRPFCECGGGPKKIAMRNGDFATLCELSNRPRKQCFLRNKII